MGFQFAERVIITQEDQHRGIVPEPAPDSFFATATLTDVQEVLRDFYCDRPYMKEGNNSIGLLMNLLNGEVQEILRDWSPQEKMSRDAYKNQEIADCTIFILAIVSSLGLRVEQTVLEAVSNEIFRSQPRYTVSETWTPTHEGLYWSLLGTLSWRVQRLNRVEWGDVTFDQVGKQDWEFLAQEMQQCLEISWTLHRLHGRSPTREILDKISRNAAKYAAGLSRNEAKVFYKSRNLNAEHFSQEYAPTQPAILGEPSMLIRLRAGVGARVRHSLQLR